VHETNQGHIATYNEGLHAARGDYLLLLSADDMLVPGALARAVDVMEQNPTVGLVFGDVPRPGEAGRPLRTEGDAVVLRGHDWLAERCATGYNVVPVPTAVVRTSVQRMIGGYLAEHPHAGDLEMWLRVAAYADVAELPTHQGIYRRHDVSMSRSAYDDVGIEDLAACWRAFEEVLTTHRDAVPDAERLMGTARRACARRMVGRASTLYDKGLRRPDYVNRLLALAVSLDPTVTTSAGFLKFRLRRALGFRASAWIARARVAVRGGRGRPALTESSPTPAGASR
jgi:glycosyltransferase involved in cell wall biosynthesis